MSYMAGFVGAHLGRLTLDPPPDPLPSPGGYSDTVNDPAGAGLGAPIAYYRFGTTTVITDEIGDLDGTYTGTVLAVNGLPTNSDGAVDFAGVGVGAVTHGAILELAAFSLSFWFTPNSIVGEGGLAQPIIAKNIGAALGDFVVYMPSDTDGLLRVRFHNGTANVDLDTPEILEAGIPHHICIRADATGFDLYVDGLLQGAKLTTHTDAWASNNGNLQFADDPNFTLDGDIVLDEVAIYDRVLTEAEVLALAQQNSAPVANDIVAQNCAESAATTFDIVHNDQFVGSKAGLTVTIVDDTALVAAGHSVTINGDNDAVVTAGAVAADEPQTFTYTITDPNGTSNVATVNITVINAGGAAPNNTVCYTESAADTVVVDTLAELQTAVAAAPAGRNILVASGTYTGGNCTINGQGTQAAPIVIRTQSGNLGDVVFSGVTFNWQNACTFVVFEGFYHNGGRHNFMGANNRLDRCRWTQITGTAIDVDAAAECRISRCEFTGYVDNGLAKRCIRPDGDFFVSGACNNLLIDYCYFHDINTNVAQNGQEPIGWASADQAGVNLGPAGEYAIVDHCLFRNIDCAGEGEFISLKTGGWAIRFCTFENVSHYLQFRAASNGEIRSCWFEDMTAACCNLFGDNHLFIGNRVIGNLRVRIPSGNTFATAWGVAQYSAARNCRIIGNRVANNGALRVGEYWPNDTADPRDTPATDNNLHANTSDAGGDAHDLDPVWQTGTTFNTDSEPFVAAVKLVPANVGLNALDPLC